MVNYSICKNTNVQGHCSTHTPVGRLATGKDVIWKITPNNSFFFGEHYGQHGANIPSGTGALWANELVVPDIPIGTLSGGVPVPPIGYPSGSLWYYPDVNGNNAVYVV